MRERRCAKRGAQILERVSPAVASALGGISVDPSLGEFLGGVVAGARQHQRRRLVRPLVVHVGSYLRSDRTTDQNRFRGGRLIVDRFPARLGYITIREPRAGYECSTVS